MHTQAFTRLIGTSIITIGLLLSAAQPVAAAEIHKSPFAIFTSFTGLTQKQTDDSNTLPSILNTKDYVEAIDKKEEEADKSAEKLLAPVTDLVSDQEKALPIRASDTIGISTFFSKFHPGLDIRAKVGTAIYPLREGKILDTGFERGGYGRYVLIGHNDTDGSPMVTLYAHLRDVEVKVGQDVSLQTVIGTVGLTGRTTGPHLHFEIHKGTKTVDPIKYLAQKTSTTIIAKK